MENYKTNICSFRLNRNQIDKLDFICTQKRIRRSVLIKNIVLDYLEDNTTNINLLEKNIISLREEQIKNNEKLEFFFQLFYNWLATWYASHPKISDENAQLIANNAVKRRDAFSKLFMEELFMENSSLFETLYTRLLEEGDK